MTSKPPSRGFTDAWEVESLTDPGKVYTVSRRADGTYACSCPRWKFHPQPRPNCKHIAALLSEIDGTAPAQMANIAAELSRTLPKNIRVSVEIKPLPPVDGLERFTVRRKFKLPD